VDESVSRLRAMADASKTETDVPRRRVEPAARQRARVQVGLIAAPSISAELLDELTHELGELLSRRYPGVAWELSPVRDGLVAPPAKLTELVDAARARLLEEGWDLAVGVTDLPLRLARRPLLTHASPTHCVALVSLPALGVRRIGRRLVDSLAGGVSVLVGDTSSRAHDPAGERGARAQQRLVELAADTEDADEGVSVSFLARVVSGNLRLLLGMIHANRPWRLVGHLSRALFGALAAGSYAVVVSDVWRISASLDNQRLAALMLATIAAAVAALITAHGLWERAGDPRVREQVALFNVVTLVTVTLGIVSLYAMVFVASLGAAAILIDSSLFAEAVQSRVDASDYLRLAWLAASLATVGGALGGVLESDAAVREAAYAYRAEDGEGA
jgi:hypothetical protein